MKKIEKDYYRNKMITETKKNADFKELHKSFVELQNGLKALDEKANRK